MRRAIGGRLKKIWPYFGALFKWGIFACVIGLTVGGVGTLFYHGTGLAGRLFSAYHWLLLLLPVSGAVIYYLYKLSGQAGGKGTDLILLAVRSNEKVPVVHAPLIFIGTILTHLCGGSSGREGAALQLGGSLSAWLGRRLRLGEKDERLITLCGMSAAFAAVFGTPLTAVVFSMEVISVGVMYYAAVLPCTISALVAYTLAVRFGVQPPSFQLYGLPDLGVASALQVALLALLSAAVSILFCVCIHGAGRLYRAYIPQPLRIIAAGLLIMAFTLLIEALTGARDYNGPGMEDISNALAGEARPEAFLVKILFTALTLGAGFKGGEIVPTFFTGATFGCVAGRLVGLSPSFGAGIGLISVFCGVTNCPIASLLLSLELFGPDGLLFFLLACAVSYLFSGYYGLYSEQKILYSKLTPEFINKKAD